MMFTVFDRLSTIALTSEQFVLQKVIKEVWYVCMDCLHHMLLPMIKWDHEGVQATPSVDFPLHHFTGRQCTALEIMMELLRVGSVCVFVCVGGTLE